MFRRNKSTRLFCALLAIVIVILATLSGCSGSSNNSADSNSGQNTQANTNSSGQDANNHVNPPETSLEPVFGGELKVAINSDPATLDIMLDKTESAQIPGTHIFETILSYNLAGEIFPGVCNYTVSDDGNVITLTIRDGVKFHDGSLVEIADIQATMERWFANVSAAKKNVQNKSNIEYNEDSIVITLTEPAPLALEYLSSYDQGPYVMPKEILDAAGSDNVSEYIGTGPYKYVDWKTDRYIQVERFDEYIPTGNKTTGMASSKMAYCDTILFYPVGDKTTRMTGVQTGIYDVAMGLPFNMYETMLADPNVNVYMTDMAITPGVMFNMVTGPCAEDVYLRQAIYYCLNMEELMLASEGDESFFYLNSNFMPVSSKWHNDVADEAYYLNDPEYAKELLAKSSYDGETLVYLTTGDVASMYNPALLAVDMMRKVGINVELKIVDEATLSDLRTKHDEYDLFSTGLTAKMDPSQIAFIASDTWCGAWASEKKTELLNELTSTVVFEERYAIWEEFTKLIMNEMPAITFGERKVATVANVKVNNMFEGSKKYFWNIWIAE